MAPDSKPTLQARWDNDLVPADRECRRALLIEVTAPKQADKESTRRSLGLSLVLDRSGSMANGRLRSAIEAALGIIDALGTDDRLSLVSFDDTPAVHFANLAMDEPGRQQAREAAAALRPGGCTNLGGGWLEGARCASRLQDDFGFDDAHVVVLSDGMANRGLIEPNELARHAGELASRGVFSSAAGVGDQYSPLQLGAIAEGGGGSLHDAGDPHEIVDVLMGELGDLRRMAARDARLNITFPANLVVTPLSQTDGSASNESVTLELGNLYAGRTRPLPLMVELPSAPRDQSWQCALQLEWTCAMTGLRHETSAVIQPLRVVDPAESDAAIRNQEVAAAVSRLWQADLSYCAMQKNEQGDLLGAQALMQCSAADFSGFVADLDDAPQLISEFREVADKVGNRWAGRSKREAMSAARKSVRNEPDHRRRPGDR